MSTSGRRPRIEVLPPQRDAYVRVTFHRQRNSGPSPLAVVAIVVGLLILPRTGFGPLIMLAALLGALPH
jgi:hypothetical protein